MAERLSRRALIASASVAVVSASSLGVAIADVSPQSDINQMINGTFAEYRVLAKAYRESRAAADAAEAQMPTWAQPGPLYICEGGRLEGGDVGWPAITDMEPPDHPLIKRVHRPSYYDIKRHYEEQVRFWCWGGADWSTQRRQKLRAAYRRQIRAFVVRARAQIEEKRKVGLIELEAENQRHSDEIIGLQDRILDCEDPALSVAVGKMFVHLLLEGRTSRLIIDDDKADTFRSVVRPLRPMLTGTLGECVDEVLQAGEDTAFSDLSVWS